MKEKKHQSMVAVGSRHDSIQHNGSHLQFISLPPNHALLSWLSRPYCRDPCGQAPRPTSELLFFLGVWKKLKKIEKTEKIKMK
jgi:hypothetical protein